MQAPRAMRAHARLDGPPTSIATVLLRAGIERCARRKYIAAGSPGHAPCAARRPRRPAAWCSTGAPPAPRAWGGGEAGRSDERL